MSRRPLVAIAAVIVVAVIALIGACGDDENSSNSSSSTTGTTTAGTTSTATSASQTTSTSEGASNRRRERPSKPRRIPPLVTVKMRRMRHAGRARGELTLAYFKGRFTLASSIIVPDHRFGLFLVGGGPKPRLLGSSAPGASRQQLTLRLHDLLDYKWVEVQRVKRPKGDNGRVRTVPVLRTRTERLVGRLLNAKN